MRMKNIVMLLVVATLPATGTTYADLSDGLIAHYTFDGNANDSSGYGNDGAVHGAHLTTDRFGNANSAYHFDGVDDYVRVPDDPVLDGMSFLTLSVWVEINGGVHQMEVLNKYGHGDPRSNESYNIGIDGWGPLAVFQYTVQDTYVIKIGNEPLLPGWHHIAGVYTGVEGKLYVDGSLVVLSRDDPDAAGSLNSIANDLLIGCGEENGSLLNFFQGSIDDIRIYDRALTASEVGELNVVPLPGALLLGGIGLSLAGWLCKKNGRDFKSEGKNVVVCNAVA